MARLRWSNLPERIEVLSREGETPDYPKPAELDAAMDEYEARAKFRLPASYREFIQWFGPGALSVWFAICAPIPTRFRNTASDVYDIDKQHEMIHDPEGYWANSCDEDKLQRLVLFASTEGGDWFFWDITDVRESKKHEYGVYFHSRGNSRGEVELIAPSFKAFVLDVGLATHYPLSEEVKEQELTYWPAWPPKKRTRRKAK